jgi:type I restriction enzyme M protein
MNSLARALVNKVWALCGILRDGGITYQDYLTELSWLLYLRFANLDSSRIENDEVIKGWGILASAPPAELLETYSNLLNVLAKSSDLVTSEIFSGAETRIADSHVLAMLVAAIDKIDWGQISNQALGDIYEGILERNAQELKSGAGQYFTPRSVVELMVRTIAPGPGEIVQDPAAGTGGFLISAAAYVREQTNKQSDLSRPEGTQPPYVGVELVPSAFRLCLMNLSLHAVPAVLHLGSSLDSLGQNLPKADVVLTNPPFGSRRGADRIRRSDLTFQTSNKQLAFTQHVYRVLKEGGRAAIVLPDGVLFDGGIARGIRQEMLQVCDVHTILRLPAGLFYAQGVKTNVLYLRKPMSPPNSQEDATARTWIYDARTEVSGRRQPAKTAAVFADFERIYNLNQSERAHVADDHPRFASFTRAELREHGDRLDLSLASADGSAPREGQDLAKSVHMLRVALTEALAHIEQLEADFGLSR